jgi:hypothetical protein
MNHDSVHDQVILLNHFGLIDADGRVMPREVKSGGMPSEEKEANK